MTRCHSAAASIAAMAMETFAVLAARYDSLSPAEADYQAVYEFYLLSGLLDAYDAAVVTRDDTGMVRIAGKHERQTRQGGWRELGTGLAAGTLAALFPAIGLSATSLPGGAGSAGLTAIAGHITAGLTRAGLKDLGELLDEGHSGLVVVAGSDLGDRVQQAIGHASGLTRQQLRVDEALVERDIDAVAPGQETARQQAVASAADAVREAEAAAAAAEREAQAYSDFRSPPDPGS